MCFGISEEVLLFQVIGKMSVGNSGKERGKKERGREGVQYAREYVCVCVRSQRSIFWGGHTHMDELKIVEI